MNPPHRLLGHFVERGDAEFKVFFLRVLDFGVVGWAFLLEERAEARLLEMPVAGQCIGDAFIFHRNKGDAIC